MPIRSRIHGQSSSPGSVPGIEMLPKSVPFAWSLCAAYMALIFYLSCLSDVPIPVLFHSQDFFLHIIEYGVLGYLLSLAFLSTGVQRRIRLYTFSIILMYGVSDEVHQAFVPLRDPSVLDVVADTLGGLLGMLVFHLFSHGHCHAPSVDARLRPSSIECRKG